MPTSGPSATGIVSAESRGRRGVAPRLEQFVDIGAHDESSAGERGGPQTNEKVFTLNGDAFDIEALAVLIEPPAEIGPGLVNARKQVGQPVCGLDRVVPAASQNVASGVDRPALWVDANASEDESGQAELALLAGATMRADDVKIGRGVSHALAVELFEIVGDPGTGHGSGPSADGFRIGRFADQANFLSGVDFTVLDGGELRGLGLVVHRQTAIGRSLRTGDAGDAADIRGALSVERGRDGIVRHVDIAGGGRGARGDQAGTRNQECRPPPNHDRPDSKSQLSLWRWG